MAHYIGPISYGKTETIISIDSQVAGSNDEYFHIESDSLLVSLFVTSIAGTLDVTVYTLTEEGKQLSVITYPTVSSPTSELVLKKAPDVMSRIRIVATYSDATTFEVRARALSTGDDSGGSSGDITANKITPPPTIMLFSAVTANTEYNYPLPVGTKFFRLKTKEGSKLQLGFAALSSGTNYITVFPGHTYESPYGFPLVGALTVYFQCYKANQTVEIESWA